MQLEKIIVGIESFTGLKSRVMDCPDQQYSNLPEEGLGPTFHFKKVQSVTSTGLVVFESTLCSMNGYDWSAQVDYSEETVLNKKKYEDFIWTLCFPDGEFE